MKIAIVTKSPTRFNFQKAFGLQNADIYYLTSDPEVKRVLKKHIDIDFDPSKYDYTILVGSEAAKHYTKVSSITDFSGRRVDGKDPSYNNFIISISPQALAFKPEMQPVFDTTLEKIKAILGGVKTTKAANELLCINEDYELAKQTLKNIKTELSLSTYPALAFDTETTALYARKGYVLGLSLSHNENFGTYIHSDLLTDELLSIVQSIIDDGRTQIIGHNAKFDIHMTKYHFNFDFSKAFKEGRMHDTMVLHYLLDERQGTHGLKSLAMKYTDLGPYDDGLDEYKKDYCKAHGIKEEDFTYDLIPWEILSEYAAIDSLAALRLFYKFYPLVSKNERISYCYTNIMMPAIEMLQDVEDNGVPVSVKRLQKARDVLNREINKYTQELYEFESVRKFEEVEQKIFNPNSPNQLRTLLFDYEGLSPTGKLTNTGAISTDAEVLEKLSEQSRLATVLLEIRKNSKLLNTFVEKMLDNVDSDGRLRTGFGITTTTSGRLSSSGTINLQQLPSHNYLIKGCIKARPGYKIVALDLSTAELYVTAVLCNDKLMQSVFKNMTDDPENAVDYHSQTAWEVFVKDKCSPKEVKKLFPEWRSCAKAIVFSVLYGSGAQSLAEAINSALLEKWHSEGGLEPEWYTKQQAQEILDNYFKKFKALKKWVDKVHKQIRDYGFVYGFFGRKRRLPNHNSVDKGVVSECLRSGLNALPQGASSDIMLQAAINMNKRIKSNGWDMKILALVHDSMVLEVREDLVPLAEKNAGECIQTIYYGFDESGNKVPMAIGENYPMLFGVDSLKGIGSGDYSMGNLLKQYPEVYAADPDE